ncbi:hypothetical protein HOL59_04650 [Candidatus Woesearchaeota archaeon]|nr:hypothetical protein [Candidatus Woesearchaeota archaeon]
MGRKGGNKRKKEKGKKQHRNKYEHLSRANNNPTQSSLENTTNKEFSRQPFTRPKTKKHTIIYENSESLNTLSVEQTSLYDLKRNRNYDSNTIDLILYDGRKRTCLLIGSWNKIENFEKEMQRIRKTTGSTIETSLNNELSLCLGLIYSSNPNEYKEVLNLHDIKVITDLPKGDLGSSCLLSYQNLNIGRGVELSKIIKHYLNEIDKNYFLQKRQ